MKGKRKAVISAFIVFHLITITCVAVPVDFAPIVKVRGLVWPYFLWTGLFQRWDMFAPDPPAVNSYIKTVVISQDRHMHVWSFPRMEELGLGERFRTSLQRDHDLDVRIQALEFLQLMEVSTKRHLVCVS